MEPTISHPAKPIATRARYFAFFAIAASSLWYSALPSFADSTYSVAIPGGGALTWATAPWTGGPGAYPGAGDTANITRGDGQNTTFDLLAGNYSVENLTYNGGSNQFRLRNNAFGVGTTFQITSGLNVERGILVLTKQGNGHQLSVETGSASVANGAILRLGLNAAGIAFKSTTTTINQGGAIEFYAPPTDNGTFSAHLGAIANHGMLDLFGGTGATTVSYDVSATSLSGSSTSVVTTSATGSGAAPKPTLRIIGNASTLATYDGLISGTVGNIAVSKEGSGIQIFSGANTYTGGTTILGGVLAVTNASGSGLGSGPVEVRNQGVLSGNGTVALTNEAIHVGAGGAVAPGAFGGSGFSTLRLSGEATNGPVLTMDEASFFAFQLGAGDQSDQVQFLDYTSGDWIMNSAGGIAINASGAEIGGIYTLFTFQDGAGNAIASGLTEGLIAGAGLENYTVLFHYGNEVGQAGYGTITMEVIPEPGSVALMLFGGALFFGSFRFRGRRIL